MGLCCIFEWKCRIRRELGGCWKLSEERYATINYTSNSSYCYVQCVCMKECLCVCVSECFVLPFEISWRRQQEIIIKSTQNALRDINIYIFFSPFLPLRLLSYPTIFLYFLLVTSFPSQMKIVYVVWYFLSLFNNLFQYICNHWSLTVCKKYIFFGFFMVLISSSISQVLHN